MVHTIVGSILMSRDMMYFTRSLEHFNLNSHLKKEVLIGLSLV